MMIRWAFVSAMLLAAPWSLAAQKVSLKAAQKAIRERILTEAGTDALIYSRVDFNDCAVTIQTRTPRRADRAETRTTYTFHATSLGTAVADTVSPIRVRLAGAPAQPLFRLVEQRIDSGRVQETVSLAPGMEFMFRQPRTATTVASAFGRLKALCLQANPFQTGSR